MFCTKCGNELPEGAKFCTACGAALETPAAIQEDVVPAPVAEPVEEQYIPAQELPAQPELELNTQGQVQQKKSKTPLWIAIGVVAAALIALIAFNFSTILSWFGVQPEPKVQLNKAIQSGFGSAIDQYDELVNTATDMLSKEYAVATETKFVVDEEVLELMSQLIGMDAASLQPIIEGISIKQHSTIDDNKVMNRITLLAEGEELLEFAQIVDMSTADQWYSLPTFSDQAIKLSADDTAEVAVPDMATLMKWLKTDRLKAIALRYMEIIVNGLTAVERTTETVTVMEVSQELTVLNCRLTEKDALKIAQNILETARTDKDIKSLIEEMADMMGEEAPEDIYASFVEAIDEGLEEIKQTEVEEDSEELTFQVYLSGNDLAGFYMETDGEEIRIANTTDGEKFGFELIFGSPLQITGVGTDKGKNGISGEYIIYEEEEELLSVELEDFVYSMTAASGSVTLKFGEGMYEEIGYLIGDSSLEAALPAMDPAIKITMDSTNETSNATIGLILSGTEMFRIVSEGAEAEPEAIVIPEDYVDADDEEAMEQWLKDSGLYDLLNALMGSSVGGYDEYDYYY